MTFSSRQFKCEWIPALGRVSRVQQRVMIVFHEAGADVSAYEWLPARLKLSGVNFLLLEGPRKHRRGGRGWFSSAAKEPVEAPLLRHKLFSLIEELEQRGWESRQIFLFGVLEGGRVAFDIGLRFPRSLAGVLVSSGVPALPEDWSRSLPAAAFHSAWFATHGIFDAIEPLDRVRGTIEQLQNVGIPLLLQEIDKGHELDVEKELPLVRRWLKARLPRKKSDVSFLGRYRLPSEGPRPSNRSH